MTSVCAVAFRVDYNRGNIKEMGSRLCNQLMIPEIHIGVKTKINQKVCNKAVSKPKNTTWGRKSLFDASKWYSDRWCSRNHANLRKALSILHCQRTIAITIGVLLCIVTEGPVFSARWASGHAFSWRRVPRTVHKEHLCKDDASMRSETVKSKSCCKHMPEHTANASKREQHKLSTHTQY